MNTIVDIAVGDDRFDILVQAVTTAGLVDLLADPHADLTVFAPTDDAFIGLATTLGFSGNDEGAAFDYLVNALTLLGGGDPIPLLTTVLAYHVAPEALSSTDVLALDTIDTLADIVITRDGTTLIDRDPDVPDPNLVVLDVVADNGIIHAIDGVLLPADISIPGGANDFLIGDDGIDFFFTHGGDDSVAGGGGSDLINAGAGNDLVVGGSGRDLLNGGSGDDLVIGGNHADIVNGGRGADTLLGDGGVDLLIGGRGNDILEGGTGNDALFGDRGADIFVYAEGFGRDVIMDANARDTLELTAFDFADRAAFDAAVEISEKRGNTKIDFGDGDIVVLRGVDAEDLDALLLF